METKPTAYHSLDEWVSESQKTAGATIYNPYAQDRKAPTAQLEDEDIDMEESSEIKLADMSKTSAVSSPCVAAQTENTTESTFTESPQPLWEEEFPPPPPDFCDFTTEQSSEQDFSIEVIAVEWMGSDLSNTNLNICLKSLNDVEFQDATCNTYVPDGFTKSMWTNLTGGESNHNSEHNMVPAPSFPSESDGDVEANIHSLLISENKSDASEPTGGTSLVDDLKQQIEPYSQVDLPHVSHIQSRQEYFYDDCNNEVSECENTAGPTFIPDGSNGSNITVSTFPCNGNDVHSTVSAGEGNDNEENTLHISSCKSIESKSKSNSPVVDVSEQQVAISLQCELPSLGVNQEATQQVLSQTLPPLSTVSMDTANHIALSKGSAVVTGESGVGHGRQERESQQTRAENWPFKESRARELIRGVLESNQELKLEKTRVVSIPHSTMESDSCDESDSGVSADFSPGSTLDSKDSGMPRETPIEREIRRAIERERSLRRSRGLPSPPTVPEYVEIPSRKAVFNPSHTPTKTERCQGKDKLFAGKKMQQDIFEEAQREQDLVKLGKIPGYYDKGTVRQLNERKSIFEAFQMPKDSVQSKAISSSNDISVVENSLSNKVTKSDSRNDRKLPAPNVAEPKNCQIIIIENRLDLPSQQPQTNKITVIDSSKEKTRKVQEDVTTLDLPPKQNPFFRLRSSTSLVRVEQDIREAQERERELRKQRINLYGIREQGEEGGRVDTEEHSSTLSTLKALPVQTYPSQNGVATPARHSSGKLGVWPPAPAEMNQTEMHHGPRTPRQKTPLVQRWESGLINAQDD